jgi:hypothetical protein
MTRSARQPVLGRRTMLGTGIACATLARTADATPDPDATYDKLLRRHVAAGAAGITRVAYGRWRAGGACSA